MVSKIFRAISSSRIRHLEPQGAGNDPNPILCAARISLTASAWAWGISESSPLAVPNNSRDRSRPPPPLRSVFRLRLTPPPAKSPDGPPPPRQVPWVSTPPDPPAVSLLTKPEHVPCALHHAMSFHSRHGWAQWVSPAQASSVPLRVTSAWRMSRKQIPKHPVRCNHFQAPM